MTNKFIRIKQTPTKFGIGGSFLTTASFRLDNLEAPFTKVIVKIDTGCSVSTIPLFKVGIKERVCSNLKAKDIMEKIPYLISYGVETGGEKHKSPKSDEEKMECSALKFKHMMFDFGIAGMSLADSEIFVNYDRKSNVLIGMDILENWDIHIGKSIKPEEEGQTVLLACPYNQLSEEYRSELYGTFGTVFSGDNSDNKSMMK